jgi:hypothetical protein
MMFSSSTHLPVNDKISFFFMAEYKVPFCINTTFSFFYFVIFTFTYMCMHCFGPPPLSPPLFLFGPLVLQFCWRENIGDNKKGTAFLLLWDRNSYTERFLALLPYTCVLQPKLVHPCQTYLLLPVPLPIVASCQFKIILFAPLQWAHKPHSSLRFPPLSLFLPCAVSP